MRLFIAIGMSAPMRRSLQELQRQMRAGGMQGRYTPEENLHLTLAFIGEYGQEQPVLDALDGVHFSPFPIQLEGVGRFGDLWWAGFADEPKLMQLSRSVRHALAHAEIPFDRKRFSPHITLLRRGTLSRAGQPALDVPETRMTVEHISLMRSTRGQNGMIYTSLGEISAT